jgi:hypothetical protein
MSDPFKWVDLRDLYIETRWGPPSKILHKGLFASRTIIDLFVDRMLISKSVNLPTLQFGDDEIQRVRCVRSGGVGLVSTVSLSVVETTLEDFHVALHDGRLPKEILQSLVVLMDHLKLLDPSRLKKCCDTFYTSFSGHDPVLDFVQVIVCPAELAIVASICRSPWARTSWLWCPWIFDNGIPFLLMMELNF